MRALFLATTRRRLLALMLSLSLALFGSGCASHPDPRPGPLAAGPYAVVLGSAQDAGLPQIGCRRACCERARANPDLRRMASSLLVVDPRSGKRWLFDASPDLREQVELARDHAAPAAVAEGRPALFDGIFLTHAHMGHYAGLVHLGREAYGALGVPVHATSRMSSFLRDNGPWSLLVETGGLVLEPIVPDAPHRLADDLVVEAFVVPHRDEFSDTVGFRISGPNRTLVYLPDIDKWERWDRRIEDVVRGADVALLDGTFYDGDELPGRDMSEVPHPFIAESLRRFRPMPPGERGKIRFTHLNHSNPAADPASSAAKAIAESGMGVADDGDAFSL